MELANIITKSEFSTEEMLFVIEQYIKERKGKDVQIRPPNTKMRAILLWQAFNKAMDWFQSK